MEKNQITTIIGSIAQYVGSITNILPINKGLTNSLFLITNHNGKQFVLKIFSQIKGLGFSKSQEIHLNTILHQQNLTPKLIVHHHDFFLLEYLQADPLNLERLNLITFQQMVDILNTINNTDPKSFNFTERDFLKTAQEYIKYLDNEIKNSSVIVNIMHLLQRTLQQIATDFTLELVLCHNDYNLDNFLLLKNKLYVIDFEFASINDIYFEYAGVFTMLGSNFKEFEKIYNKNINPNKLNSYTTILKCLSILWCYLMDSQQKNKSINYLEWADLEYKKLFKL